MSSPLSSLLFAEDGIIIDGRLYENSSVEDSQQTCVVYL